MLYTEFVDWVIMNTRLGIPSDNLAEIIYEKFPEIDNAENKIKIIQNKYRQIEYSNQKIFVGIAAYRDPYCVQTINDILDKAKNPENINIFCLYQASGDKDSFISDLVNINQEYSNVTIKLVDYLDSQGTCWARSEVFKHMSDEFFFLQVDSHSLMVGHWDEKLKKQYYLCPSEKPLISYYPSAFKIPNLLETRSLAISIANDTGGFTEDGIFSPLAVEYSWNEVVDMPVHHGFIAGGFIFGPAQFLKEVPYDPHLYFFGEEFDLSTRAWTHGYDVYAATECYCWHLYQSDNDKKIHHWDDQYLLSQEKTELASQRLKYKLGLIKSAALEAIVDIDRYSLGTERRLADYESFIGIDLKAKEIIRTTDYI